MEFGLIAICHRGFGLEDIWFFYSFMLAIAIPSAIILHFCPTDVNGVFEAGQYVLYQLHRSWGGTIEWKHWSAVYYPPQPGVTITLEFSSLILQVAGKFPSEEKLMKLVKNNALYRAFKKAGLKCYCRSNHLEFIKLLNAGEVLSTNFVNWIEITIGFAAVCQNLIDIVPGALHSNYHCAFCKEAIQSKREIVFCSACRTPQHPECFRLNQRCSVFGCSSVQWLEERVSLFDRLRAS